MFGIFRKKKLRSSFYPRKERIAIKGDVYIKRSGYTTLRSNQGNISDGGLYVQIPEHDLDRGKKVEIVLVSKDGPLRRMSRMMGIIISIDDRGVAMVTYKKQDLDSQPEVLREEEFLKQEFGVV